VEVLEIRVLFSRRSHRKPNCGAQSVKTRGCTCIVSAITGITSHLGFRITLCGMEETLNRRATAFIGWIAVLAACAPGAQGQVEKQPLDSKQAQYSADFETVWKDIKDYFWDSKLGGVDWKKIGDSYRPQLTTVKNSREFTALMNKMVGELKASHTSYYDADDFEFYMIPAVMQRDMNGHQCEHGGLMGKYLEDGSYELTGIMDGGPAQKAGLHAGDVIVSADGNPFTTAGSFRGKEDKSVHLMVKRDGVGQPVAVDIMPAKQNLLKAFLAATRSSAKVTTVQGKKIAYIHLWTMANDQFKQLLDSEVTGELHNSDGMILDLRDGFGGNPFGYSDVFTRPDVDWSAQFHNGFKNSFATGYHQPIVLLINGGTRSAKEFLSYQLQKVHRAKLVGTTTAGAFLGAGSFNVADRGVLEMAIQGLRVDGKLLEAKGVSPDINVAARHSYQTDDAQYQAALIELLKEIRAAPAAP
jgi:carboxyl-terminal processing protease